MDLNENVEAGRNNKTALLMMYRAAI